MTLLVDPVRLKAYRNALANWRFEGYVRWKEVARDWVRVNLDVTPAEISRRMHEYVQGGGAIDEVVETRPEWTEARFHYDLRLVVRGRPVYVETLLFFSDPDDSDDPWIKVVSIYEQQYTSRWNEDGEATAVSLALCRVWQGGSRAGADLLYRPSQSRWPAAHRTHSKA
jgi:hypothetical protein